MKKLIVIPILFLFIPLTIGAEINDVELVGQDIGDDNNLNLIVNITATDPDSLEYKGVTKTINSSGVYDLSIPNELQQKDTLYLNFNDTLNISHSIDFLIESNQYVALDGNLSYQEIEKDDNFYNYGDNISYNITHYMYDSTCIDGCNFLGINNATLYSKAYNDFLDENIGEWTGNPTKEQTTEKQYIKKSLNITTPCRFEWNNIDVGNATELDGFGNGNYLSHNISVNCEYYNDIEWMDYGDGIVNEFEQDITDVILSDRVEWWEEYHYESDIVFENVSTNVTVSNEDINWGHIVRVDYGDGFKDLNLTECDNLEKSTFDGDTYKACYEYINSTSLFFRLILPHFSEYDVRYGARITQEPIPEEIEEGDECIDLGADIEKEDGTILECYRYRWFETEDIKLPKRDISDVVYHTVTSFTVLIGFTLFLVIFFKRDSYGQ